jgi:peptide/nickel transport system ATP-binding protein
MTDAGQQPPRRRRSPASAEPAAQPTPAEPAEQAVLPEQAVPAERAESAEWLQPTDLLPAPEPAGTGGPRPVDRPAERSRRRLRRPAGPLLEDWPVSEAATRPPGRFLEVRDLRVHFPTQDGLVRSVDGLSFGLERGRTLGIVGESGSGKSVTSLAIMGLHERTGARISGEIWLDGEELLGMSPEQVRRRRGQKMAMIFQDPLSALHPYYTVGNQIIEAYRIHVEVTKKQARQHAIDLLGRVGIPQPATRVDDYPHQFSGGMRQRAMIAMALSCDPALLIADEPTTALDVTVQAEILDLIRDLQSEFGSAVIIITHDLGVVAELADTILVMYAGRGAEYDQAEDIFHRPEHPYTWGLLGSMPRLDQAGAERLIPIPGVPPSLIRVPPGCAFHPRCRYEQLNGGASQTEVPAMVESSRGHEVACHLPAETRRRIWETEVKPLLAGSRTEAR